MWLGDLTTIMLINKKTFGCLDIKISKTKEKK